MASKGTTRYYSAKQEHEIAKLIEGRTVVNSGATTFCKGDVENEFMLVECKTCIEEKKSFAIKKEWLDKLEEEAFAMNKNYHALAFNFGEYTDNYFILNERAFKQFLDFIRETEVSADE